METSFKGEKSDGTDSLFHLTTSDIQAVQW